MLTKIKDGWWIDIPKIINFFNSEEQDQCFWYLEGSSFTYQASFAEGKLIEAKIKEYYEKH